MAETALGILAASWGVVMALSPVLQIRRIVARRSSEDLSLGYLAIVTVGFSVWIAYEAVIGNPTIIVPNSVALSVGTATMVVAVRYRSGRSMRRRRAA
jgi:uncharacterized protein with PQ loop repeat